METRAAKRSTEKVAPKAGLLRAPIYVPLITYVVLGTALCIVVSALIATISGLIAEMGIWALSPSTLLSRGFWQKAGHVLLELTPHPWIAIPMIFFAVWGSIHHYFAGKFGRRWVVLLIMVGLGGFFTASLSVILIHFVQQSDSNAPDMRFVYLVAGVLYGGVGSLVNFLCASVAILVDRRFKRKRQNAMVRDVF